METDDARIFYCSDSMNETSGRTSIAMNPNAPRSLFFFFWRDFINKAISYSSPPPPSIAQHQRSRLPFIPSCLLIHYRKRVARSFDCYRDGRDMEAKQPLPCCSTPPSLSLSSRETHTINSVSSRIGSVPRIRRPIPDPE